MAAHDAEGLANPAIEELVRDRQLNLHVLERWRKYLAESRTSGKPVFSLWHAAAAIPTKQFADRWQAVRAAAKTPALVDIEVNAKPIASLKDLAGAYAAARFSKADRVEPFFSDPEAETPARAVSAVQGRRSDVPVEEFELIYTEGDSDNREWIRVRYNTMLAQAAYDAPRPARCRLKISPNPKARSRFSSRRPNNPGPLFSRRPRFLSCLDGSEQKVFQTAADSLILPKPVIIIPTPTTPPRSVHSGSGCITLVARLVRTPSDFGHRGSFPLTPTARRLAIRFIESGWLIKKLHRLILSFGHIPAIERR